ncbi:MAG: lnt [Betaproteobacteria bacterium]|nr:lnt [Betaproteobacteria bacterium]
MLNTSTYGALFRFRSLPLAAICGGAGVLGFAPFGYYPVLIAMLAVLLVLWRRADSPRHAAYIGFVFGLGFFLSGVSWVYVSLHDFGAMPAVLAAFLTLLFCCILAAYPAIIGYLYRSLTLSPAFGAILVVPALWTIADWVRGWLFTGFPWLALGYSQVPASPLAGYVPVIGVYGATFIIALSASLLVMLLSPALTVRRWPWFGVLVLIWLAGYGLRQVEWTSPVGAPVSVSLLQGNIPQDLKWQPNRVAPTLKAYQDLVTASHAKLVVLPETALPLFLHEVPQDYLDTLAAHARSNGGDVLVGVPELTSSRDYYNSVQSFGMAPSQTYRKSHLVPFGEFIPLKPLFGWFFDVVQIPLLDFSRGAHTQQPLDVAGQRVAVNVCYEDVFGAEIIRQLPEASLLVNVSNVAWFGRSVAPRQHMQISQTRALETGRYMLRATNTGMTAIIDQRGEVIKAAPEFERATVNGEVQGYAGATPFVRWGNFPIVAFSLLLVLSAGWLARRGTSKIRDLPIA